MIVFEYLYGMMDILSPLMDEWANGEHRHVDIEDEDMVRVYFSMSEAEYIIHK